MKGVRKNMSWVKNVLHTDKAIIGLCHFKALPGDPFYDEEGGMEAVYEAAYKDVMALQEGGIDAIQFTNEFSMPYSMKTVDTTTVASMAALIGRLKEHMTVPFGANCIGDALSSVSLCCATGAKFTRGTFHGAWATNYGLQEGECHQVYRLRHNLHYDQLKLIHYVVPESSSDVGGRDPVESLKAHYFLNKPDAFGVCGLVAGQKVDVNLLSKFKEVYPDTAIFAVTGVNSVNAKEIMSLADAAFVGTALKKDGKFKNPVDVERVKILMKEVKKLRGE